MIADGKEVCWLKWNGIELFGVVDARYNID